MVLFIAILIYSNTNALGQENKWTLSKKSDEVTIYTREDKATGLVGFKASVEVESDIETLIKVINNVEGCTDWVSDIKVSRTLSTISNNEQYLYFEASMPWPLENRDLPIYQKTIITSKGAKISLVGKPDYIPHKNDIIRIEEAIGSWELISLPNNKVKVISRAMIDPGVNVPYWVIRLFIVDAPYKTLMNLKAIVEL